MSTTIDYLQIEIRSNSTNAASSINDLEKALKKLNKNGDVSNAIASLNGLRNSLHAFVNMPSNASKIDALSNSLKSLSKIKPIDLGSSLGSIKKAMDSLGSINVDNVAPQIERIAGALAPLNNVKGSGFNSMMNGFKKLNEVVDSLDSATIDRFVAKIKELDEKLGPVSQKLVSIGSAFKGVNSKALEASGGMSVFGGKVNTTTLNLQSLITTAQSAWATLQPIVHLLQNSIGDAIEWTGIEHQFGNAFGEQADEYYEKITNITNALKINKQMFMENSAMATSMLRGFGVNSTDARQMGLGYTELAYDIWAAFNNVYKSFDGADGAMAAVRSAIAGEVEPIRRAGFTIVDSQLKITAANHGLAYSSDKATEAQKSYLRYLTLVDQAQTKGIIGTYASEMDEAEGMVRTLTQQLKSLSQTFGSLFIPVLVKVIPYLQAFIELLGEAIYRVAAFFGVEIQRVDFSGYSKGVGSATEQTNVLKDSTESATKAVKELKNAAIGIDELNVISPPSASGGSGGGSGSGGDPGYDIPVDSIWDDEAFKQINDEVATLKKKLEECLPIVGAIAAGFAAIKLVKLIADIDSVIGKLKLISGIGGGVAAIGGFVTRIKEFFAAAKQAAPYVGWFAALFPKLSTWFASLGTAISSAVSAVGAFLAGITAPAWVVIVAIIASVASVVVLLVRRWNELGDAVKNFFNNNIVPKLEKIKESWEKMKSAISGALPSGVIDWFKDAVKWVGDLVERIGEWFKSIDWMEKIGRAFELVGGVVLAIMTGPLSGAFNALVQFISGIAEGWSGIVQILASIPGFFIALFSGDNLLEPLKKLKNGVVDLFKGMYNATVGVVVNFVKGIISWFTELWDVLVGHSIVPDTINAIVDWFKSLPKKIFGLVSNFVTGIVDRFKNLGASLSAKFSSAWQSVKSWWSKKPGLAAYTPSIGKIWEKVRDAWASARTWWNEKKSALKQYTPSIGSISQRLKDSWNNARDWWNKKTALREISTRVENIKTRISNAWSSAKTWWNKNTKLSTTPAIGSIKNKLVSAWNDAKAWWKQYAKLSPIPSLNFKVTYTEASGWKSAIVRALGLDGWPKLSFAAGGGIFDTGSLVWAGESGAEIVANASGGKTGVMNVQQMSEAVYEGVYAAVVAAMRANSGNGNGSQSVNVYLDGKQITASVEKRQRERGATIMGSQVYSY